MKKLQYVFITLGFTLLFVGCADDTNENDLNERSNESSESNSDSENVTVIALESEEELEIFTKAVDTSKREAGIVNMDNPQYRFTIGADTFFLWIAEESGTIMNRKDTHTVYSLSAESTKEVYEFIKK
ncbi:hypothetical protein ACERII_09880 [Evansella sp. AB-rgal1]|uniref:hypothetical protein n=1 Tax=Evansella sp. AB-rgal1 TaxID=3242696 RepID=UPI00359EBD96